MLWDLFQERLAQVAMSAQVVVVWNYLLVGVVPLEGRSIECHLLWVVHGVRENVVEAVSKKYGSKHY